MAGDKYLKHSAGEIVEQASTQTSAGAGDAGKIPALDSNGRLALAMMPSGVAGSDVATITASEALAAGDLVNIHDSTGAKARKADASGGAAKKAHGFVTAAVSNGAAAEVHFEGPNTGLSGLTPGDLYLSATPGGVTSTPPSTAGHIVQKVGVATSTTDMNFEAEAPIVLA